MAVLWLFVILLFILPLVIFIFWVEMLLLLQLSTARDFWGESLWHIACFDNFLDGTSVGCISHVDCCFLLFVLYFVTWRHCWMCVSHVDCCFLLFVLYFIVPYFITIININQLMLIVYWHNETKGVVSNSFFCEPVYWNISPPPQPLE